MAKEGEGVAGVTGSSQDLAGKSAKPVRTSDENWKEMKLKAARTIQLCLTDKVMYNMMNEKMSTSL